MLSYSASREIFELLIHHAGEEGESEGLVDVVKRLIRERTEIKRICDQWTEHESVFEAESQLTNLAERVQISLGEAASNNRYDVKHSAAIPWAGVDYKASSPPITEESIGKAVESLGNRLDSSLRGYNYVATFPDNLPPPVASKSEISQEIAELHAKIVDNMRLMSAPKFVMPPFKIEGIQAFLDSPNLMFAAVPKMPKRSTSCDCGALRAKTTHADWCSVSSK